MTPAHVRPLSTRAEAPGGLRCSRKDTEQRAPEPSVEFERLRGTSSSNEGGDYICAENERENPAEQTHIGRKPKNEQYDCDDGDDSKDVTGCVEHRSPLR
jgi:hypothetical protein